MTRYATIITGDDGREIVSAVGEFEGAAPFPRLGRAEQVAPGVRIGMVRDGGGFCFPQAGTGGQFAGLVLARLKARAGAADRAATAKPAGVTRPKRTKKAGKKTARLKKPASRAGSAMPKAGAVVSAVNANTGDQADD